MCKSCNIFSLFVYFKGVRKMVVMENLLYILDAEVRSMALLVVICYSTPWCSNIKHFELDCMDCFLFFFGLRMSWVFGTCISLSWFTVGQILPSMTLSSPQNVALPPWWRKYHCLSYWRCKCTVFMCLLKWYWKHKWISVYCSQDRSSMKMITLTKQGSSQVTAQLLKKL